MHIQQSTPFGRFDMVTTCNRCGGRGKIYEKSCKNCKGNGRVIVTEKFRITVEQSGKSDSDKKDRPKGRFFGVF
jgi:DnaJ-class molecular chaperone